MWEIQALPVFTLLKTKAFQKFTLAANSASSQIQREVCIPQRDGMPSSPSPVVTPREEPLQIVPLQERHLQGPPRPT